MEELDGLSISIAGGQANLNFSEAALLVQGSTVIYSKKVEHLHALIYQVLEALTNRARKRAVTLALDDDTEDAFARAQAEFEPIADIIVEAGGIDLPEVPELEGVEAEFSAVGTALLGAGSHVDESSSIGADATLLGPQAQALPVDADIIRHTPLGKLSNTVGGAFSARDTDGLSKRGDGMHASRGTYALLMAEAHPSGGLLLDPSDAPLLSGDVPVLHGADALHVLDSPAPAHHHHHHHHAEHGLADDAGHGMPEPLSPGAGMPDFGDDAMSVGFDAGSPIEATGAWGATTNTSMGLDAWEELDVFDTGRAADHKPLRARKARLPKGWEDIPVHGAALPKGAYAAAPSAGMAGEANGAALLLHALQPSSLLLSLGALHRQRVADSDCTTVLLSDAQRGAIPPRTAAAALNPQAGARVSAEASAEQAIAPALPGAANAAFFPENAMRAHVVARSARAAALAAAKQRRAEEPMLPDLSGALFDEGIEYDGDDHDFGEPDDDVPFDLGELALPSAQAAGALSEPGAVGPALADYDVPGLPADSDAAELYGHIDLADNAWMSTYEKRVREHLDKALAAARAMAVETSVTRTVDAWRHKLEPLLAQQEEQGAFDPHATGSAMVEVLASQPGASKADAAFPLHAVMRSDDVATPELGAKSSVARSFLAALMLAAGGNVELRHPDLSSHVTKQHAVPAEFLGLASVDDMLQLHLLEAKLSHTRLDDFDAAASKAGTKRKASEPLA